MERQLRIVLLVLILAFLPALAFGDDSDSVLLVPKTVKRKHRSLASVDMEIPTYPVTVTKGTHWVPRQNQNEEKDLQIRIMALGGRDSLSSPDNQLRSSLGEGVVSSQWAAAVDTSLIYGKYLGLEVDAFYNLPGSASGSAQSTTQSQYGGMANPMIRYPIRFGSVLVTPKAGAGFGYLSINEIDATSNSASQTISTGVSGLYGTAGFDLEISDFLFTADYARSLTASANYNASGSTGSALTGASAQAGYFDRIRLGLFYKITNSIYFGGQFISRTVDMTTNSNVDGNNVSTDNSTSYNQYLGGFMFQF